MAVIEAVILNAGQRNAVIGMTRPRTFVEIDPRLIDAASPGESLNTNPNAAGLEINDPVSLDGKFIVNTALLIDQFWAGSPVAYFLATRPWGIIDSSVFVGTPWTP